MLKLFKRLLVLRNWLSDRAKRIGPRRFGRVGGVFIFSTVSFFVASLARAAGDEVGVGAATTIGVQGIETIFGFFADWAFTIAGILTQGIVLMIDILVPIMTYNSFVTNPVVTAGWAIVRDTVNMFFVIVLIIIAFGTIFGHQKFQWSQQVSKLLVFAIVINFSKTLAGIMIDFGQVIMLTFANALREIAAGNFIQLLGLNSLYAVSQNTEAIKSTVEAGGRTLEMFDFLAAGVMSVILTMFVLGTLIMMVVILIYRIIGLWVLVVVAPLCWFVGGASGIIQSDAYSKWWDRFKCLVGIGPVLAFFLWLTLAVAGAGNVAANSGFSVSAQNAAGLQSTLLEPKNFMSFLIGMALLMAGLDAAQQLCSSLSGTVLGKSLQRARSGALQRGALALGLGAGIKGAGAGLRLGAKAAYRAPGAISTVAQYIPGGAAAVRQYGMARESLKTEAGRALQRTGATLGIGRLERAGVAYTSKAKAQAGIARTEETKKAKEGMKNVDRATKLELMKTFARQVEGGAKLSVNDNAQYKALLDEAMTDKRMQKEARASGVLQKAWEQKGQEFSNDNKHDSAKLDQIQDFKKSNADFTKSSDLIEKWDDVKALDDDALKDEAVRERLKNVKSDVRGENGVYMTAYDAVAQGLGGAGEKKQKSLTTESNERFERMKDPAIAQVSVNMLGANATILGLRKAIEAAMRMGDETRARSLMSQMGARVQGAQNPTDRLQAVMSMRGATTAAKNETYSQETARQFNRVTRAGDEAIRGDVANLEARRDTILGPARERLAGELRALEESLAAARASIAEPIRARAEEASARAAMVEADPTATTAQKEQARLEADTASATATEEAINTRADTQPEIIAIKAEITTKSEEARNPALDPATQRETIEQLAALTEQLSQLRAYLAARGRPTP